MIAFGRLRFVLAVAILTLVIACSHTPTDPDPADTAPTPAPTPTPMPSPSPTPPPSPSPTPTPTALPPIVLTGSLFADSMSGGGNVITANVCGCVSAPLTLVSTGRPVEPLACNETHFLGYPPYYDGPLEVTVSSPTWSITATYTVPIDPHVGLKVRAECRSK